LDDSGFDITFEDGAANGDIHEYRNVASPGTGLQLTGTWQPDGRDVDPMTVMASDNRAAFLSSFNGLDPNGVWTLTAVDRSGHGLSQIQSWGIEYTAVPEPRDAAIVGAAIVLGFALLRRRFRKSDPRRIHACESVGAWLISFVEEMGRVQFIKALWVARSQLQFPAKPGQAYFPGFA
jgi:hypothetical protein